MRAPVRPRLPSLSLFAGLFDCADHVESLLGQIVVLAFHDFLEAGGPCLPPSRIFPSRPLNCCATKKGLREEAFDFAGARDGLLVVVRKFFDTENGDNVLQFLVALQHGFHGASHGVMFLSQNARIQNTREAGQRIDRGIDTALDDRAAEVRGCVQVGEGCRRRRIV